MDLHRIGVKLFLEDNAKLDLLDLIPVFHRWIQTHSLDGLLIDVADYSHLDRGPGILLVAHEGNYGLDESGGRRGLVYYSKRPLAGTLSQRIESVCQRALTACRLLEEERSLDDSVRFVGNELELFFNDRLRAPNTHETMTAVQPAIIEALARLYPQADPSLSADPDPKARFSVLVRVPSPTDAATLLERCRAA